MKTFAFLMSSGLMLAVSGRASGQVIQTKTDWLIDPTPYRAVVTSNATELVLENGLARRVIRLAPNAATVALQNLTSGEHVLRAIAPEARVTLGGTKYEVGGLGGQPVNNYLQAERLDALWANPYAYRFVEWKELPLEARLNWKMRSEWLSRDLPWPPPGRHVVLRFVPPADQAALLGPVILDQWFEGPLQPEWQMLVHAGLDRASFRNEGKTGEIMAYKDGAVCAEHPWPAGAVSVELLMDSGDDRADPWGPGLALIVGGKMLKFITNPGSGTFSVNDMVTGTFDRAKPCKLHVTIADGKARCEASQKEDTWQVIAVVPCPALPTAVRVGKVGLDGSGKDKGYSGPVVRCHMKRVTWRGAEPSSTKPPGRLDLPEVDIHYEIYDGLPLFSKWLVIRNTTPKPLRVNSFVSEELRLANVERGLHPAPSVELPLLHVETDYSFGSGAFTPDGGQHAVSWGDDAGYARTTQSGNGGPTLLQCKPPLGPEQDVAPGASFETYRAFELLLDSTERERSGLAQRRMYRTIAPWSQENPLMFHKLGSDAATIREAIAQAHEVGFEMIIMSFGSGFNFENTNVTYIAQYKELADEAKAKGIALGGYSLLASRGAGPASDNTQGSPAMYGVMPCLGSKWGQWYLGQLQHFLGDAGLGVLEHDGSYPGDKCAATNHPFHHGLKDSQWVQWRAITDLYKWCTGHGVYLNIPDWYFLTGGTKTCMGYRESNWSLPRAEQELIERQNMFDGTWQKTPSMGWMFVPLSEYGGGGAAATIEPLDQHRAHYEARLANLLGYGVQACYRGPRLYDTEATKALVKKWVTFYKRHRQVLDSDIIHLRRANGLDWDGILHVNPAGKEKGLLMLYNPLETEVTKTLRIPLYYTGKTTTATVSERDGQPKTYPLDREYNIELPVRIPARGMTWFAVE
jgi:hypothetical protein